METIATFSGSISGTVTRCIVQVSPEAGHIIAIIRVKNRDNKPSMAVSEPELQMPNSIETRGICRNLEIQVPQEIFIS